MKTCKHCVNLKHYSEGIKLCKHHECKVIDYAKAQNCPGYTTSNLEEKPEQKEQWMVTFMTNNGGIQTHFLVLMTTASEAKKSYMELKEDPYVFYRALSKVISSDSNK